MRNGSSLRPSGYRLVGLGWFISALDPRHATSTHLLSIINITKMATCEALVTRQVDDKPTQSKQQVARPEPAANQVLVKLSHVAQNPTDGIAALQTLPFHPAS